MNGNQTAGTGQSPSTQATQAASARNEPSAGLRAEASRSKEELKHEAEEIASAAKDQASAFASEQKERGADHIDGVAKAVDRAAEELERSSPELARYAREAASTVHGFSDSLRNRSVGDLCNEVSGFARRNPGAFFGASIAAGFALSRFLASNPDRAASATSQSAGASGGFEGAQTGRQA